MESQVEKLYKNAGLSNMWVERYDDKEIWHKSYNEMISTMMRLNDWTRQVAIDVAKKECRKDLPPFTVEKQLEIVKFLLNKSVYYDTYGDREYWFHLSDEIENSKYREFDEAIAECINKMWEDLRDYEKVQIKEILE